MQKYIENQLSLFDFGKKKMKITKPIRLIELFAGIGSQAMAFESLKEAGMLSVPVETHKIVEFDDFAVKSYNAIHGTHYETSDITKIKGADLKITDKDLYEYLMFYSFPCFTKDTLVLTKRGYIPIKDVVSGDEVLTHNNRYQKVIESRKTGTKEIWEVRGMPFESLKCTENHLFYTRIMDKESLKLLNPTWIPCNRLTSDDYLGISINQHSSIPEIDDISKELLANENFWWIIGKCLSLFEDKKSIHELCVADYELYATSLSSENKYTEIIKHLNYCNIGYLKIRIADSTMKINICSEEVDRVLQSFGTSKENLHLPGYIFDMPVSLLKAFLDGYGKGTDARIYPMPSNRTTAHSRELIYGLAQIAAKIYHVPYSIFKGSNNTYFLEWYTKPFDKSMPNKAFYEDGYIWFQIGNVMPLNKYEDVYDIMVENTHSFTANGCIVHNCTDLSTAGLQKGMSRGSGTRSGLLWEVERILKELHETDSLPQILWMENVPQVIGEANLRDFNEWLRALEKMGYHNRYDVLNANNFGVPQTRNRCFMISTLEDVAYEFPHKIPLSRCIRDVLEKNVDEKYYLKTMSARELISNLLEREDVKGMLTIPTSMSGQNPKPVEISPCVTTAQRGVTKHLDEGTGVVHGFNVKELIQVGNLRQGTKKSFDNPQTGRVYLADGSSPTLNTCGGGDRQPKIIETVSCIAASRGRNPDNPRLRRNGMECKQSLELKEDGTSNTITTVKKDNYVFEGKVIVDNTFSENFKPVIPVKENCSPCLRANNHGLKVLGNLKTDATIGQRSRLIDEAGVYPTITATDYKGMSSVFHREIPIEKLLKWGVLKDDILYLIRKLTPKECFRLMGYTDASFDAASSVVSNSQCYKQAGNAIVKQVLMALFLQMGIGEKTWNELSVAERDALVGGSFLEGKS